MSLGYYALLVIRVWHWARLILHNPTERPLVDISSNRLTLKLNLIWWAVSENMSSGNKKWREHVIGAKSGRQSIGTCHLTHWVRDKMVAIFADDIFKCISWMKMYTLRLKFHWSLFPRVQSTIFKHWFRERPGDKPLSKPMMAILLTNIFVTRPQWVNDPSIGVSWHVFHAWREYMPYNIFLWVSISIQHQTCLLSPPWYWLQYQSATSYSNTMLACV